MKSIRTHSQISMINVRGLLFIYILLVILTLLLSISFFSDPAGVIRNPGIVNVIVFFTIPVVLFIFFAASVFYLIRDLVAHRRGSRFRGRVLTYFIITAILATAPSTIIITQFFYEFTRIWERMNVREALRHGQDFAMDYYHLRIENLGGIAQDERIDALLKADTPAGLDKLKELKALDSGLESAQDFVPGGGGQWVPAAFIGRADRKMAAPPSLKTGYVPREIPRDTDIIRYVWYPSETELRVVSYSLEEGFDEKIDAIAAEEKHFEVLSLLRNNMKILLVFFYGVFFLPTLLMTFIIAMSLSRLVTQPIIELAEATTKVAEGNYSIQILSNPKDELGFLISSFNAMVRDLENSRAALVRTEKQSIWQSMAQQLAHEIKNPLTPIRLSAERVLRRWRNEPERVGEIIENSMLAIIQEVESLSGLLTEFRTLSKPIEASQASTILREVLDEMINPYKNSYPGMEFRVDYMDPGIIIKIDKKHFSQVMTNLIINAIDASEGKGLIDIRSDLVKKRDSRYCRLSIKDSGKGIAADVQSRIFTPYFTTKDSGTGLGLPIVERIISNYGGTIWFNSAPGAGTTFFIDLPVDQQKADGEAELKNHENPDN